jgi:hypothetical protein
MGIVVTFVLYVSNPNSNAPPGYFTHIFSLTTLVVPALKNHYIYRALEAPTDFLKYFWIQVAVS